MYHLEVSITRHEEELLFEPNVCRHTLDALKSEKIQQTSTFPGHGVGGAQQRSLLVECVAGEGNEGGRDEDGVTAKEDGRGGVDGKISTGSVGGT